MFGQWREFYLNYNSEISKFLHYVAYQLKKPSNNYSKGILIFSIDVDVGSEKLSKINNGKYDRFVNDLYSEKEMGKIEEKVVPVLIQLFDDYEIPVTFALRGQLTEVENSIFDLLIKSSVKHDIGAHGYLHKTFTDLSEDEVNKEFEMISIGMGKYGIQPKSFIFPKNKIAHLPTLEKWGYTCFRAPGGFLKDGLYVKKYSNLVDVHPGLYVGMCHNPRFLDKILDLAITYNAPFHIWFHPSDLGISEKAVNNRINSLFKPFLNYAKKKQRDGYLSFKTMKSMADMVLNS